MDTRDASASKNDNDKTRGCLVEETRAATRINPRFQDGWEKGPWLPQDWRMRPEVDSSTRINQRFQDGWEKGPWLPEDWRTRSKVPKSLVKSIKCQDGWKLKVSQRPPRIKIDWKLKIKLPNGWRNRIKENNKLSAGRKGKL